MLVLGVKDTTFINSYLVLSKNKLCYGTTVITCPSCHLLVHPHELVSPHQLCEKKIIMSMILLKTILSPKCFTNNYWFNVLMFLKMYTTSFSQF